ncbi:hypothetical protein J0B02_14295 [Enterobacteriaceae bacterium YMB-R22]|uniref:virulence factor SrfC family protein n=1 Tax=Tenebrionicola larvae TaxID=2815733 RepID=UPI002011D2D9|nr:virulence factor SrfC family protein [Tenebrionicola larvae]MBV4413967.1 hypothetical protein [Tenebrionicola larvae]
MSVTLSLNAAIFDALGHWVSATRQQAPLLDDVADGIQLRLLQLQRRYNACDAAASQLPTVGLWGHCAHGKAHLRNLMFNGMPDAAEFLTTLAGTGRQAQIAVSIGPRSWPEQESYPLCLMLFNEGELAQIFMRHYLASGGSLTFDEAEMRRRLDDARHSYDSGEMSGIDASQVAQLAAEYRRLAGGTASVTESETWYRMACQLPQLSVAQRARCFALLWGDTSALTRRWLSLAMLLQQLGNARYVLASGLLAADRFHQPAADFLAPDSAMPDEMAQVTSVCPLLENDIQAPVIVTRALLSMLCAEMKIGAAPDAALHVLDIPGYRHDAGREWCLTKSNFLSELYRQRCRPERLIICQAMQERKDNQAVAARLIDWMPVSADNPRAVWAVTPFDARFAADASVENTDSAVQSLLDSAQYPWGVFQALTDSDARRLTRWLSDTLSDKNRQADAQRCRDALAKQVGELLCRWLTPPGVYGEQWRQPLEDMLRTLQQNASEHGALLTALLPSRGALQNLWRQYPPMQKANVGVFDISIDLFSEQAPSAPGMEASTADFEHAVQRLWVNHLRQWAEKENDGLSLPASQRRTLCDILITMSYRLELPGIFSHVLAGGERSALADSTRVMSELSDFITWLGYAGQNAATRPASRWNPGQPIFAPGARPGSDTRLTKLGASPVHAATHYVYDWLVALWTRAVENVNYRHPLDISIEAGEALRALLDVR